MDKQALKIEALTQRIAEMTVAYETRIADLRVEFTEMAQQFEELKQAIDKKGDTPDVEVADTEHGGPISRN